MLSSWRALGPALSAEVCASLHGLTLLAREARDLVERSLEATDQRIRIELSPVRL